VDKALFDDYLCLVALNNIKLSDKKSKKQLENSEMDNSLTGADCRSVQNIAPPITFLRQEDKDETNKSKMVGYRLKIHT